MACKYKMNQPVQQTASSYETCPGQNFGWLEAMQTEAQKTCCAEESAVPEEDCGLTENDLQRILEMLMILWKRRHRC